MREGKGCVRPARGMASVLSVPKAIFHKNGGLRVYLGVTTVAMYRRSLYASHLSLQVPVPLKKDSSLAPREPHSTEHWGWAWLGVSVVSQAGRS